MCLFSQTPRDSSMPVLESLPTLLEVEWVSEYLRDSKVTLMDSSFLFINTRTQLSEPQSLRCRQCPLSYVTCHYSLFIMLSTMHIPGHWAVSREMLGILVSPPPMCPQRQFQIQVYLTRNGPQKLQRSL